MSKQWSPFPVSMPGGPLLPHMGARVVNEMIQATFVTIGGAEAFADWAENNKDDFYKMWAKTGIKPSAVEVSAAGSVDDIVNQLSASETAAIRSDGQPVEDAQVIDMEPERVD